MTSAPGIRPREGQRPHRGVAEKRPPRGDGAAAVRAEARAGRPIPDHATAERRLAMTHLAASARAKGSGRTRGVAKRPPRGAGGRCPGREPGRDAATGAME
jgi:hypothetical protein